MVKLTTKNQAIKAFGNKEILQRAIGVSRQAIDQWPDRLTKRQRNEVLGAYINLRGIESVT